MRQIFENAYEYNNENDQVYKEAKSLEKKFEKLWKKVEKQIEEISATKPAKEKKAEKAEEIAKTPKTTPKSSKGSDKSNDNSAKQSEKTSQAKPTPTKPSQPKTSQSKTSQSKENREKSMERCLEVLDKVSNDKHAWPFEEPVDAKKLKLKDYHKIVKEPMDLSTIRSRLQGEEYKRVEEEFHRDMHLVFDNALLFNHEGDPIHEFAEQLKMKFDKLWAKSAKPEEAAAKSETPTADKSAKKVVKQEREVAAEASQAPAAEHVSDKVE